MKIETIHLFLWPQWNKAVSQQQKDSSHICQYTVRGSQWICD